MKKIISVIVVILSVCAILPMTTFARGYGYGGGGGCGMSVRANTEARTDADVRANSDVRASAEFRTYELCNVEGCELSGTHCHDGVYYCGHFDGDGHDYHEEYYRDGGCHGNGGRRR